MTEASAAKGSVVQGSLAEDSIGSIAQRISAAVRGGMPAARAWSSVLGRDGPVAELLGAGGSVVQALAGGPGPGWRALAAAWQIAEFSGAPMAETLERLASSLRALERLGERRAVLLAGPRATIRLVAALPVVGLGISALLGFDPIRAASGPGAGGAVALGVTLLALGVRWAGALTRRLADADWVAGWEFELAAIAVSGGGPPGAALRRVVDCADRARAEWVPLEALLPGGEVSRVFDQAAELGTALGPTLLREAAARREAAHHELERAAERLSIQVLVPLGVCVLPAFVLLVVVPVLLAVVAGA